MNEAARVAAGAEFLDKRVHNWREQVDVGTLLMLSGRDCILGQMYGSFWDALDDLDIDLDDATDLGFTIPEGVHWSYESQDWDSLQAEWTKVLTPARGVG